MAASLTVKRVYGPNGQEGWKSLMWAAGTVLWPMHGKRVIRLSTERTNKSTPYSLKHQQDALMFVARSRLACRRTAPITQRYYSASSMANRDYAVSNLFDIVEHS